MSSKGKKLTPGTGSANSIAAKIDTLNLIKKLLEEAVIERILEQMYLDIVSKMEATNLTEDDTDLNTDHSQPQWSPKSHDWPANVPGCIKLPPRRVPTSYPDNPEAVENVPIMELRRKNRRNRNRTHKRRTYRRQKNQSHQTPKAMASEPEQ